MKASAFDVAKKADEAANAMTGSAWSSSDTSITGRALGHWMTLDRTGVLDEAVRVLSRQSIQPRPPSVALPWLPLSTRRCSRRNFAFQ